MTTGVTSTCRLIYRRWRSWFLVSGCIVLASVALFSWTVHRRVSLELALRHTYDPYEDWAIRGRYAGEQGVKETMERIDARQLAWLKKEGGTPGFVLAELIEDVGAGKGPWVSDAPSRGDLVRAVMGRWWWRSTRLLVLALLVIVYPTLRAVTRILSVSCVSCGYSRRQSISKRCPECGTSDPLWRGSEDGSCLLAPDSAGHEQEGLRRTDASSKSGLAAASPPGVLFSILRHQKAWWIAFLAASIVSAGAGAWVGVQGRKLSRAEQAVYPYWEANADRYVSELSSEDCIRYASLVDFGAIRWLKSVGGTKAAELAFAVEALAEGEFRSIDLGISWLDVELEVLGYGPSVFHAAVVCAVLFAVWPLASTLYRLLFARCVWCGHGWQGSVRVECAQCGRRDPLWRGVP